MSGRDDHRRHKRHTTHGRSATSTGRDDYHDPDRPRGASSSPPSPPPKEGDIYEGEIVKIESYGAFCSLLGTRWQGLIHISQLYGSRVEHVEDVVSLNDRVWVKVIQVEQQLQQQSQSDYSDRRPRLRIKLSLKDVSQDGSRQDLGRQRDENQQVKTQLETNLNSMIGVAVARDPMENQRLILKGLSNVANKTTTMTFRGGYTLVGDDEGEVPGPVPPTNLAADNGTKPYSKAMGRGRGTTLPAWMTSMPINDGPIGEKKKESKNRSSDSDCDTRNGEKKRKRKRHKKSSRKDYKRRSKKSSRKKHNRHNREDSSSDGEDDDYSDCSFSSSGDRHRSERPYKREREHRSRSSHDDRNIMRRHSKNCRHDDSVNSHGSDAPG